MIRLRAILRPTINALLAGAVIYTTIVTLVAVMISKSTSFDGRIDLQFVIDRVLAYWRFPFGCLWSVFRLIAYQEAPLLIFSSYFIAFFAFVLLTAVYYCRPIFFTRKHLSPFLLSFSFIFLLWEAALRFNLFPHIIMPPPVGLDSIIDGLAALNWAERLKWLLGSPGFVLKIILLSGVFNIIGLPAQVIAFFNPRFNLIPLVTPVLVILNIAALSVLVYESGLVFMTVWGPMTDRYIF